jgi:membrane protease YdiL (CAAX protease family)
MTETAPPASDARRERFGLEILCVLGVSLGISAINSVLNYGYNYAISHGHISNTTATVVSGAKTSYPVYDFLYDMLGLLNGIVPPLLALLLLSRSPAGRGFGVGFDLSRRGRELRYGIGFLALIGIPGLLLVYTAHKLGFNASLNVVDFPNVWYRVPYLVASAFQNGLSEEIIVVAFLLTRLRQLGWSNERALGASALLRGTYHLYQGWGAFAGNAVMGLIFGWWFQRTRRVVPLVIAHFLLDAISFVGYVYLHSHISWI